MITSVILMIEVAILCTDRFYWGALPLLARSCDPAAKEPIFDHKTSFEPEGFHQIAIRLFCFRLS